MSEVLFEKTFKKAQEIQLKNIWGTPNDLDYIFICYGYSKIPEERDLAIAKVNTSWAEIHLKNGLTEIYDPSLDTYLPSKYFYRIAEAICMYGLDVKFVELLHKKLGKYGPFDKNDIDTLKTKLNSEELGAMKGGSYWKITQKLQIEDENKNQICIIVERKGTKLNFQITTCPKIFETPYEQRKDYAIMTPTVYKEMEKLQDHLINLAREGMWDEVFDLFTRFPMLKFI